MFSHRHYEAIANVLRTRNEATQSFIYKDERLWHLREIMWDMIYMFESDNPRFKRERFIRACGFES